MSKSFLYETHMHTSQVSACATNTAAEQVREYKALGYTGIIVTDHFINGNSICPRTISWEEKMRFIYKGYEAAKKEGQKIGLDVFFGWEFSIRGSDFLTYGLDLEFLLANPGLDRLPIKDYSALVRENGGYLAQAHPFRVASYIEYQFPVSPEYLDAIEVFNASLDEEANQKAYEFAKKYKLAMQAGSDSHNIRLPIPSGIKLGKKAESIQDIINAIKAGEVELVTR